MGVPGTRTHQIANRARTHGAPARHHGRFWRAFADIELAVTCRDDGAAVCYPGRSYLGRRDSRWLRGENHGGEEGDEGGREGSDERRYG